MSTQFVPVMSNNVLFKGNLKQQQVTAKLTDEQIDKMKEVPETIEQVGGVINDSLNTINSTMQETTKAVGGIAVTGTGLLAVAKKPFVNLINWMKEPLKDVDGNVIKEILKDGTETIKKSDKFSKNKVIGVAIAAGVVIIGITASIITKKVKKAKAEKLAQEKEAQKNLEAEIQAKESKQAEETKLNIVSEAE